MDSSYRRKSLRTNRRYITRRTITIRTNLPSIRPTVRIEAAGATPIAGAAAEERTIEATHVEAGIIPTLVVIGLRLRPVVHPQRAVQRTVRRSALYADDQDVGL